MKLKPQTVILTSTLFVLAGIAVTMATGLWQTESDKVPRQLETVAATDESAQTKYDPADIRGSYTFGEISELFQIPLATLADAYAIPLADAEGFQVKALEQQYPDESLDIGTSSVRLFVAWYLGVSYESAEESFLPKPAVDILLNTDALSQTQRDYLASHTAILP